ncbi:hypothetical protein [Fervidibacillus halotolerans]|uniref:Uncharacterized protein n=1 Tax=Fervidibacillus halotolerans TaxID=2980027 RepID=A0A9E8LZS6_9BACI|nr:hypothetical protein [Fervidibacillus halotolerans]WAA12833.1 hypothetical protein OE105_01425 [Fervidibacillus halotolerans]
MSPTRMYFGAILILLSIIISETGWNLFKKEHLSRGKVDQM